jgi:hypothetical protein
MTALMQELISGWRYYFNRGFSPYRLVKEKKV